MLLNGLSMPALSVAQLSVQGTWHADPGFRASGIVVWNKVDVSDESER